MRSGSAEATAALSRQGRYQRVAPNLRVNQVRIAEGERFVICFNPDAAERDAGIRARRVALPEEMVDGSDRLSTTKRAELRWAISIKPGLHRYLRVTPGGLLRVNAATIKAESNLDGEYLLRASKLSAEDIALGYEQLLEVPRLARPPAGHRSAAGLPPQGRTHPRPRRAVLACAAAGPPRRDHCGGTWPQLRHDLDRITIGTFAGPADVFRQRTEITKPQRDILAKPRLDPPPRIYQLTPAYLRWHRADGTAPAVGRWRRDGRHSG